MSNEEIGNEVPPLLVADARKCFQQGAQVIEALRGVSLRVGKGEFVAIMGASGSGKSTLLHAMAGLTDLDGGTVTVDGLGLKGMGDSELTRVRRERIGLVFQSYNLMPLLSAIDNIRLPVMDDKAGRERALKLLERLGLADRANHKPDRLSGGEQQRVAIARALVTEPAILLADEPTGNLDSVAGAEICDLLGRLAREEGRSIVIVTHEPAVALAADRVLVLRDGCVVGGFETAEFPDAQGLAARYQDILRSGS